MESVIQYALTVISEAGGAVGLVLSFVVYGLWRINKSKDEVISNLHREKDVLNKEVVEAYTSHLETIIKAAEALGSVNSGIDAVRSAQEELLKLMHELKVRLEK